MSRLANWFVSLADRWARWRHRRGFAVEPRVEIGPTGPRLEYVKPKATEEYGWDPRHYERGNVHYQDIYNPIEVRPSETNEDKVDLLPSDNYKAAMIANEVIPKAMNPEPFDLIKKITMATGAIAAMTLVAVIALA